MKPIPEFHRVSNNLCVWHGYNPECKTDCSSTAVRTPDGWALIDPLRLEEAACGPLFGDATVADAMLDRIMQNNHRLTLTGESLRKTKTSQQREENRG